MELWSKRCLMRRNTIVTSDQMSSWVRLYFFTVEVLGKRLLVFPLNNAISGHKQNINELCAGPDLSIGLVSLSLSCDNLLNVKNKKLYFHDRSTGRSERDVISDIDRSYFRR